MVTSGSQVGNRKFHSVNRQFLAMVTFGSHVGNHQFQPFLSGVYAGVIPLEYFKLAILKHLPFSNGTIELFLDLKSRQGPRGSFSL